MSVKLYVDMRSQPCRALLLFLKASSIDCEVQEIDLFAGEHKKPEYMSKFPLMTVPGLSDGDYHLGETMAIFRYLTTKFAGKFPDNWYPADPKGRARVDEYMAFHHTGTRGAIMPVFVSEVLTPMTTGSPAPKDLLDKQVEKMTTGLNNIEKGFLKDKQFLTGSSLSFADALCITELMQFTVQGRDIAAGRPKVKAYMERVKGKMNPSFDEIHTVLYAWRDSFKK